MSCGGKVRVVGWRETVDPYVVLFPVIPLEGLAMLVTTAQSGKLLVGFEPAAQRVGVRRRV